MQVQDKIKIEPKNGNSTKPLLGAVPVHKFPYDWHLKDANFTKDKGKVFSCFACGGGSTMGYKLAGFDVIGHNDIDKKMIDVYKEKGLLVGEAKEYVRKIYREFDLAGYYVQHWLFDASKMGVPQKRERVFFIAMRKDIATPFLYYADMFTELPKIDMEFNEPVITLNDIKDNSANDEKCEMTDVKRNIWNNRINGDSDFSCTLGRIENRPNSMFNNNYLYGNKPLNTITSKKNDVLFDEPRHCNFNEYTSGQTYPKDYNFLNMPYLYLLGMSVPPVMTAQISTKIYEQWLSKL
jgi:DNA (cytosine-5)-methyltransferase 1